MVILSQILNIFSFLQEWIGCFWTRWNRIRRQNLCIAIFWGFEVYFQPKLKPNWRMLARTSSLMAPWYSASNFIKEYAFLGQLLRKLNGRQLHKLLIMLLSQIQKILGFTRHRRGVFLGLLNLYPSLKLSQPVFLIPQGRLWPRIDWLDNGCW